MTIFVIHASEDKEAFVRPLVHKLKHLSLKLWYDEFSLRPGDSLRRSLDRGLAECSAGIVILSPAFFAKEWPQRELDALVTKEIAGRSKLIPIWYNVDRATVAAKSPLLADRVALDAQIGIEAVARKIADVFPPTAKISGAALAQIIEQYPHPGLFAGWTLVRGCQYRFLKLNAFKEESLKALVESAEQFDEDIGDLTQEEAAKLDAEDERLRLKHRIPDDVYLIPYDPVDENDLGAWEKDLRGWVSRTLSREDSTELVRELDLVELDEYYILLNVPNFAISADERDLLEQALVEIGCGLEDEYEKVSVICAKLRELDENC